MFYLYALPTEQAAASGGTAKALAAAETASGSLSASLGRSRALAWASAATGTEAGTLNAIRAMAAALWGSSGPGPQTPLHYAAGSNFDGTSGAYLLQPWGFNLADVSSLSLLNLLPDGVLGLVYVGMTNGADATFQSFVTPFLGNPKVYGFYLADEPIDVSQGGTVTAANLKAESDWIHANFPGAKTFIVLENNGTPSAPSYSYTPANTGIDLFGIDPYPVRPQFSGGIDLSVIDAAVSAATAAGIPLAQLVPAYQAFGGGGYASWAVPTPDQTLALLARWASLVPAPAFDYVYAWGEQSGDTALVDLPDQQAIFASHNGVQQFTLSRSRALVWTAAATTTQTSTLTGIHVLAWSASSAATEAATLLRSRRLVAALASAGVAQATLTRSRALAASETAIGVTSFTLSQPHGRLGWTGTAAGSLSAALTATRPLTLTVSATGALAATARRSRALTWAVGASGTLAAPLAATRVLAFATTASGAINAILRRGRALSFASSSSGALSALLLTEKGLEATLSASGTFVATLDPSILPWLTATLSSSGVFAADIAIFRPVRPGRIAVIPAHYAYDTSLAFAPIEPPEEDYFAFDWSSRLTADAAGDQVVSAAVTAIGWPGVTELTVSQPVVLSPFVQVTCSMAAPGDSIGIRCGVTLKSGRRLHWTARLPVLAP